MLFGGWSDDEIVEKADNFVYKQLKKARYRSIELCELDLICDNIEGDKYQIIDFHTNGCPIVRLITNNSLADITPKTWVFDNLFIIKSAIWKQ